MKLDDFKICYPDMYDKVVDSANEYYMVFGIKTPKGKILEILREKYAYNQMRISMLTVRQEIILRKSRVIKRNYKYKLQQSTN